MSTSDVRQNRAISRGMLVIAAVVAAAIILIVLSVRDANALAVTGVGSGGILILLPAAFLAGVFSFLSPCTLPILPAYFAFTFQARRERVVFMSIAFFLGLATTMVLLGASATALSRVLFQYLTTLTLAGGLLVIGFGVMSLLGKGFGGLQVLDRPSAGFVGSYIYGATFALGWTACVGPILGALLTLLATQGIAVVQGAILAFVYALGLGSPLILVATFFTRIGTGSRAWRILRGRGFTLRLGRHELHLHSTSVASGLLLILMGALLASGQLSAISTWSQRTPLAQWALSLEQVVEGLLLRR